MKSSNLIALLIIVTLVAISGCDKSDNAANQVVEAVTEGVTERAVEPTVVEVEAAAAESTTPIIDPNTADEATLASVSGLSAENVQKIIAGRPFASASALHAVIGEGMSAADQKSIYSAMYIKIELNTAAKEDIVLIPSSMPARKLAHEVDEYRPYKTLDQWKREMKKYVSDEEVENLARYAYVVVK